MNRNRLLPTAIVILLILSGVSLRAQSYQIVDTGQELCYDTLVEISSPLQGETFYGQDAQYDGHQANYQDNGDGTVTDLVTGLMWQKYLFEEKLTYDEALEGTDTCSLGGHSDWRLPSIKELYSLIQFNGTDPSGPGSYNPIPFIDTLFFEFRYGDTLAGERIIDAQYASSTEYSGLTMGGDFTVFGVNFADGRIKGYGTDPLPGQTGDKTFFVRYVRGNPDYGTNNYIDEGEGTIKDVATGMMWDKHDSGQGLNWQEALAWVEQKNMENHQGYSDWRLPNAKELQSIVDYSRSPQATGSASIDPVFNITTITDEGGNINYPFYWTGTTHASANGMGQFAVYVSFGEALGWMEMPPGSGNYLLQDVHGAGSQRSDPKSGDPVGYPHGHGPQGDVVRIYNYVRLVRNTAGSAGMEDSQMEKKKMIIYPNPAESFIKVRIEGAFEGEAMISISNLMGQRMEVFPVNSEKICLIDVGGLPPGMYLIDIITGIGRMSGKFIKR